MSSLAEGVSENPMEDTLQGEWSVSVLKGDSYGILNPLCSCHPSNLYKLAPPPSILTRVSPTLHFLSLYQKSFLTLILESHISISIIVYFNLIIKVFLFFKNN